MYRAIVANNDNGLEELRIIVYITPIFYEDSEIFQGDSEILAKLNVETRKNAKKYSTDVNTSRIINGPLSKYGEELENPIKMKYEEFLQDCRCMIEDCGITIIHEERSTSSKKSQYYITFGIDNIPYGKLIYDFRISDHGYGVKFPEELKDKVLEYLKVNKVLDGTATKAGIDFAVKNVIVGSVKNDTWNRALNRAYAVLDKMRLRIRKSINREKIIMVKVRFNSDKNLVKSIKALLVTTKGYCPCSLLRNDSTRCMCKEFRDFVQEGNTGLCHCGLYEAYEEE